MNNFNLKIITPENVFYDGNATYLVAPGEMGQFVVLCKHEPLIANLRSGCVVFDNKKIKVNGGVINMHLDSCIIIVEYASFM